MSLPPLVMVVWVWPLVHATICALLGSPEASNLASGHDIYTLTHFHNERISDAVECFNTPEGFWLCPYICADFNTSPLLFFSSHAVQRLHSCHLPNGFVVVLRGRKERSRARLRPSGRWCMASGEETQHRRWENVEMYAWHDARWGRPTVRCV